MDVQRESAGELGIDIKCATPVMRMPKLKVRRILKWEHAAIAMRPGHWMADCERWPVRHDEKMLP